jgi:excisionase family DNA binding protein
MPRVFISVSEAAEILKVDPSRIHQRIREGSLPAEKIGQQWALKSDDVRRLMRHAGPGRPLSSKSAWDLLAVALNDQAAAELSPSARSRARSRLRNLLVHAAGASLDDVAAQLERALSNRAQRLLFFASPRDLPEVRDDERVHLSGVSLPESNMSAGAVAEGYVSSRDIDPLVDDHLLSPAARSRANVVLHVVPSEAERVAIVALYDLARSPLALAADLAEYDGVREKNQAVRSVADLHARLIARDVGASRG